MKKYLFLLFFIVTSLLGTAITEFSLGIWTLKNSDSTFNYILISFCAIAPQVLLSPFIGSVIDRWNKKAIIVLGQLFAGVGSLVLMFLFKFESLEIWHIIAIALINSIANGFAYQAFYVSTISLVPRNQLSKAKGWEQTGFGLVTLLGPVLAPFIYKFIDMNGVFLLDVVTFSVSVLVFLFVKIGFKAEKTEKLKFGKDAKLVWQFIRSEEGFLPLLGFFFILNLSMGGLSIMFTPLVLDFADESTLGVIMSLDGVGMLLGGVVVGILAGTKKPIRTVFNISLIIAVMIMGVALKLNAYTLGISVIVVMTCNSVVNAMDNTFWQTIVPDELQGRVSGYRMLIIGGIIPFSYLVSGFILELMVPLVEYIPIEEGYYPGTEKSAAIMYLFVIAGFVILVSSLFLRNKKYFKKADNLFAEKITHIMALHEQQNADTLAIEQKKEEKEQEVEAVD
jgi:MFS transporter, DHA3 family, macrolide efflux protein